MMLPSPSTTVSTSAAFSLSISISPSLFSLARFVDLSTSLLIGSAPSMLLSAAAVRLLSRLSANRYGHQPSPPPIFPFHRRGLTLVSPLFPCLSPHSPTSNSRNPLPLVQLFSQPTPPSSRSINPLDPPLTIRSNTTLSHSPILGEKTTTFVKSTAHGWFVHLFLEQQPTGSRCQHHRLAMVIGPSWPSPPSPIHPLPDLSLLNNPSL